MIRDEIVKHFGSKCLTKPFGSVVRASLHDSTDESKFIEILEGIKKPIDTIVEIGTCCGISSVILAGYAKKVITFDIQDNPIRFDIWKHFFINDRIKSHIVKDSAETAKILESLKFDAAFIDGSHETEDVKLDIQMTEKCGRLIFHDFDLYCRDIIRVVQWHHIVNGGRFMAIPPFAYWERTL